MDNWTIRTAADALSAPRRTSAEENEYRRGYCDGFIAAVNALPDLAWLSDLDRIAEVLYEHWEQRLENWRRGLDGAWLPPEMGEGGESHVRHE